MPNDRTLDRAALHEAGHLVLALHHHLNFGDLKSENGRPAIKDFDLNQDPEYVAEFLVAGIAAERIKFNDFDKVGARDDLCMLRSIASKSALPSELLLLKKATAVLHSNMNALESLTDEIINEFRDSAFDFSLEPLLLDRCSIQRVWEKSVER